MVLCWVEGSKAWLLESSPVNKWLKLSVLSLHNLSHGLVEEVLCGVSPASALWSGSIMASHGSLLHLECVLRLPWNLVLAISYWVDLMVDNEILAVIRILLLIWLVCWLGPRHSWHWWNLLRFEAWAWRLESVRTLLLELIWAWHAEARFFLGRLLLLAAWGLVVVLKSYEEVLSNILNGAICNIVVFIVVIIIVWDIIDDVGCVTILWIAWVWSVFWLDFSLFWELCLLDDFALWIDI